MTSTQEFLAVDDSDLASKMGTLVNYEANSFESPTVFRDARVINLSR